MKKLIFLLILLTGIVLFLSYKTYSPCDLPIPYKIGQIDPKFGLSKADLEKDVNMAAETWSGVYGKKLFSLYSTASLTINLVYDERQRLNSQIGQLQNKVGAEDSTLAPKIAQYQSLLQKFKEDVAALNSEINSWNQKGGAPPDVYQNLKIRQADLQKESDTLNAMAASLNQSASSYNQDVNILNNTIDKFNQTISLKPEEGVYISNENKIVIYFATNKNELIHTLAHELGHALGLDHTPDPNNIMYGYTSEITKLGKQDIGELQYICRKQTLLQIYINKINAKTKAS